MNKFLRGKIYNRCCLGYILLSAAIHRLLHLEPFLKYNDIHQNFVNDELESWKTVIQKVIVSNTNLQKYVTCLEEAVAKSHRKTVQFWINYAYLLDMYLIF